ncbi:hypothetical protein MMC29_004646 [Sticta canariensis]|nr:hypothetical protein [Sticta canariensis]
MPAEAAQTSEIPYHPAPSVGHELGIMFGFMAIFVISMGVYLFLWKLGNRRNEAYEIARREKLAQRGFGDEKSRLPVVGGDAAANTLHGGGGDGELVSGGGGRG